MAARTWHVPDGRPEGPVHLVDDAWEAAFSPDGRSYIIRGGGVTDWLRDSTTGQRIGGSFTHPKTVASVAFSPDGGFKSRWTIPMRWCFGQSRGHALDQLCRRGAARPLQARAQAPALDVLELNDRPPLEIADRVNLHDVRVAQPGDDLRLGQKPFDRFGPGILAGQDHLEGDQAVQAELARLVDDAHPAPAKLLQDLVTGHPRALEAGGRDESMPVRRVAERS